MITYLNTTPTLHSFLQLRLAGAESVSEVSLLSWTDKVSNAAVFKCSLIAAIAGMNRCSYENHEDLAYLYAAVFRKMTWVTPERALPFKLWIQCEAIELSYKIHQLMYMSTSSLVE